MTSILVPSIGGEALTSGLSAALQIDVASVTRRSFPDGETYVRLETDLEGASVAIVGSLNDPDPKLLPLIFMANTARELGAGSVGLVAPYLAYMRQDRRFNPGEAITSQIFGQLLSQHFDWLITVDPHLHRYRSLKEIYGIPTAIGHAASVIAEWIAAEVDQPCIVGPDAESEQWVADVARRAGGVPFAVMEKTRRGDRDVRVSLPPNLDTDRTVILLDDIISSGGTMVEAVRLIRANGSPPPVCVAVHGVFADNAFTALMDSGAARVVTSNSIQHSTNGIDIVPVLVPELRTMLSL